MESLFRSFQRIGHLEAISFLILLLIAMPLKYLAHQPWAVKIFGWAHGVLFILYFIALLRLWRATQWSLLRPALLAFAAFIPFGPFIADRWLQKWKKESLV
ncbi:MAG: DUF3817 domain-containing protein [Verrucomicrobiales bacterium]|nr:DUF3817 domain-containing protein [Verrucomicrobiales bacterium]